MTVYFWYGKVSSHFIARQHFSNCRFGPADSAGCLATANAIESRFIVSADGNVWQQPEAA
jgi:hypothetical protein